MQLPLGPLAVSVLGVLYTVPPPGLHGKKLGDNPLPWEGLGHVPDAGSSPAPGRPRKNSWLSKEGWPPTCVKTSVTQGLLMTQMAPGLEGYPPLASEYCLPFDP